MKYLVDVDDLERKGVFTPDLAAALRASAERKVASTAINTVLGFGAAAVAAGLVAEFKSVGVAAALGAALLVAGYALTATVPKTWSRLASIWMVVGALMLSVSVAALLDRPLEGSLVAAAILVFVGLLARSRLLMAAAALALGAAVGGSAGYWRACYAIALEEPTLTIALFSLLAFIAWRIAIVAPPAFSDLILTFARTSVVLVNFGFWIGSLYGNSPGSLWRLPGPREWAALGEAPRISAVVFALGWALALLAAGYWGARNGRRFMVNSAATFGAILFYTQWYERLGLEPASVIGGGLAAIGADYALWRYNARAASA